MLPPDSLSESVASLADPYWALIPTEWTTKHYIGSQEIDRADNERRAIELALKIFEAYLKNGGALETGGGLPSLTAAALMALAFAPTQARSGTDRVSVQDLLVRYMRAFVNRQAHGIDVYVGFRNVYAAKGSESGTHSGVFVRLGDGTVISFQHLGGAVFETKIHDSDWFAGALNNRDGDRWRFSKISGIKGFRTWNLGLGFYGVAESSRGLPTRMESSLLCLGTTRRLSPSRIDCHIVPIAITAQRTSSAGEEERKPLRQFSRRRNACSQR